MELWSCGATGGTYGPVESHETTVGPDGASQKTTYYEPSAPAVVINGLPDGTCASVTFVAAPGGGGTSETHCGGESGALAAVPEGDGPFSSVTIALVPCEACGGTSQSQAAYPYRISHQPISEQGRWFTSMVARATSRASAEQLEASVNLAGPGAAVPGGVDVNLMLQAELQGSDVILRSALPQRFDEYTVKIDGVVVADLATSSNVSVSYPGHGWSVIESSQPAFGIPAGALIEITQRAAGASAPVTHTVRLSP